MGNFVSLCVNKKESLTHGARLNIMPGMLGNTAPSKVSPSMARNVRTNAEERTLTGGVIRRREAGTIAHLQWR